MKLNLLIESAEIRLKQILEDFFISIYDENLLPSHGLDHHRRVWQYAKELLLLLSEYDIPTGNATPENLVIASYLHDIGMSEEPGEKHGFHSRELCRRFLEKHEFDITGYRAVLDAIENHDNKKYNSDKKEYNLLSILSVADDLDAFGFTGVFRYAEIYLARDVELRNLGSLVATNAKGRFENFRNLFGFSQELSGRHLERFDILINFCDDYSKESASYDFEVHNPEGNCGVVQIISRILKGKALLKEVLSNPTGFSNDEVTCHFFRALENEINFIGNSSGI
jgi:hypothetical protein